MAAIHDPRGEVDLAALHAAMHRHLPNFARPLFVRLMKGALDVTGTFKLKKFGLQREGFDPRAAEEAGDVLFFLDASASRYEPLSHKVFQQINEGQVR